MTQIPKPMSKSLLNKYGYTLHDNRALYAFPLHYHEYYEMELITDGEGVFIVNGIEYPVTRGSFCFLRPTDLHEIKTSAPLRTINIPLSNTVIAEEVFHALTAENRYYICKLDEETLGFAESLSTHLYKLTYQAQEGVKFKRATVRSLLTLLISLFFRFPNLAPTQTENAAPIFRSISYIHLNFTSNPPLSRVANESGLQVNYFCKKFKRVTGKTYTDYLNELKIDYSCRLLQSTNLSVIEICFTCGFASVSQFNREFKKRKGVTPVSYRKSVVS